MGGGGEQVQRIEQELDPNTQNFIENHLRPGAIFGAQRLQGLGGIPGLTGTSKQGIEALRNLNIPGLEDFQARSMGLADNLGFASQQGLEGIGAFFDPFQQEVIGGVQGDFARQRDLASNSARQQATRAGAFGGSRSAVLEAELLGGVNRNEASTLANLRSGGFQNAASQLQNARSRAGQLGLAGLSNLGNAGQLGLQSQLLQAQGLMGAGDQERNALLQQAQFPFMQEQAIQQLLQGGIGPTAFGSVSTGTAQSADLNPFSAALGGAGVGASVGGAPGALVGGGLGLLGGFLF